MSLNKETNPCLFMEVGGIDFWEIQKNNKAEKPK